MDFSKGSLWAGVSALPPALGPAAEPRKAANTTKKKSSPHAPVPDSPRLVENEKLLRSMGEEVVGDLLGLMRIKKDFVLYDGFEPSGRMHIAQGVYKANIVNAATSVGGIFVFWVADWFALMNDKMGGDLEKIKDVGCYLIEVWKAAGMKLERVEFKWASEEIGNFSEEYWDLAMDVSRRFSISRVKKCCQIMGRKEGNLTAAQILYPIMQCTDVFFLKADVCQLGLDQRKVNMLAIEYCDFAKIKRKPVILSHHMLSGLKEGQVKMSKSDSGSAVFMEDSYEDVEFKIRNAYCPTSTEEDENWKIKNPVLDYAHYVVFKRNKKMKVGDVVFEKFADLVAAVELGDVSADCLKTSLALELNAMLDPVRVHFESDSNAKALLERVRSYKNDSTKPETIELGKRPKKKTTIRCGALLKPPADKKVASIALPYPTEGWKLSLSSFLSTIKHLDVKSSSTHELRIIIPDMASVAMDLLCPKKTKKFDSSPKKNVEIYFEIFVDLIKIVKPDLKCNFIKQSELVSGDASNYWISAINAGRAISLSELVFNLKETSIDENRAGSVVAGLMHVADVLATCADVLIGSSKQQRLHRVAASFYTFSKISDLPTPTVVLVTDALAGVDEFTVFDSPKQVRKKISKLFCEPKNVLKNPVLKVVEDVVLPLLGELRIETTDGEIKSYVTDKLLVEDFASGLVHPKDLKAAAADGMVAFYEHLTKGLAAERVAELSKLG